MPRSIVLGGETLTLRPLAPDDATRLQDFFYSHTFETVQLRYGHAVTRMTPERAHDLVGVDQTRDLAIAIFGTEGPGEVIHAVGRYYLDPGGRTAEAAFVVRESKRRRGLGACLLQTIVAVAQARGLDSVWGRVRRDNLPMLTLFRRFGGAPAASTETDGTELDVRISLRVTPSASAAHAPENGPPRPRIARRRQLAAGRNRPRPNTR